MDLIINDETVEADAIVFYDDKGYGIAEVNGVKVRYSVDDTSANFDPFDTGTIFSEDIQLLAPGKE